MSRYSSLFYEVEEKSLNYVTTVLCTIFGKRVFSNQSANMIVQY